MRTPSELRALGFKYDADETYKDPHWPYHWRGFVEPILPSMADGDEYDGFAVIGEKKADLDKAAIEYATEVRSEVYPISINRRT